MGKRRKARELVLQALYEAEFSDGPSLDAVFEQQRERQQPDADTEAYARMLFMKTAEARGELDEIIRNGLENWDMERVALVDKNILRFALTEVLHCQDVPSKVILNEAIEIANRYSTADAGRFINGLLDRFVREYRKGAV